MKNIENISNANNIKEINKLKDELKELKSKFPFEIKKEDKIMSITIISFDENIIFSTICKNTENISRIEKLFYKNIQIFPKLIIISQ